MRVLTPYGGNLLNVTRFNYHLRKLAGRLSEEVGHREVIKEMVQSVERSWVYYVALTVAGLIALLGLLTNSVAAVIGAMLISPLMGPIISSSLAFTIGDLQLARRAFKTIAVSVALTILVSALVSFLSPLKEPTAEILSRVRPNILDLLVAVLSGAVGAVALCTRRNYLITSTGVAVATAVIPPLSVTGYALGTGQPMLAIGGFLLFFTNFVAIILASDLVFFILGFRSTLVEAPNYSRRTRYLVVSSLLVLISVPLVYTLVADVAKIKEMKRIERTLKRHLNREGSSRLTGYQQAGQGEGLRVQASVNSVGVIDKESQRRIEEELSTTLKRPVTLILEQVMVASGDSLSAPVHPGLLGGGSTPAGRSDSPALLTARLGLMAQQAERELADALAPFPVTATRLTFGAASEPLRVSAELGRDYPLSSDEEVILARQLERVLQLPVSLSLKTVPLLPPLAVERDGTLHALARQNLGIVKRLPGGAGEFRFLVTAQRKKQREAEAVRRYLSREHAIPERLLSVSLAAGLRSAHDGVTLRIVRNERRDEL